MRHDEIKEKLMLLQPTLKQHAIALTKEEQSADELVQEVTLKVLCNMKAYYIDKNFEKWTMVIMNNIFANECRRLARQANLPDETFVEEIFCDDNAGMREIIRLISLLPNECRTPLKMFIRGYKYCEIAERMNIPIGTVKSRIHIARTRLREIL
ncbi:MAG: RNA polymerase sigma factor [Bacteroidaceae bacterium]|nr:RNA polymerase sigma factor [Bacteroidaceae bacterium]